MAGNCSQEMRQIERTLAYLFSESTITSACHTVEEENLDTWYDLDTAAPEYQELDDAVVYLDSRGLLEHNPQHPRWVMIRDEDANPIDVLDEAEQRAAAALAEAAGA